MQERVCARTCEGTGKERSINNRFSRLQTGNPWRESLFTPIHSDLFCSISSITTQQARKRHCCFFISIDSSFTTALPPSAVLHTLQKFTDKRDLTVSAGNGHILETAGTLSCQLPTKQVGCGQPGPTPRSHILTGVDASLLRINQYEKCSCFKLKCSSI